MTHIRRPLVGLVVLFAGAVTLDRIGLGHREETAIAVWVYLLAAATLIGTSKSSVRQLFDLRQQLSSA